MFRRAAHLLGPLAVIYGLLCTPSSAQDGPTAKRCSPPTTLLQLYADRFHSDRVVVIDRVEFDGPIHLPDSEVARAVANANNAHFKRGDMWLSQFVEIGLRGAWQNEGYYRAKVTAEALHVGGNA